MCIRDRYWSSSEFCDLPASGALYVSVSGGNVYNYSKDDRNSYVRPVLEMCIRDRYRGNSSDNAITRFFKNFSDPLRGYSAFINERLRRK